MPPSPPLVREGGEGRGGKVQGGEKCSYQVVYSIQYIVIQYFIELIMFLLFYSLFIMIFYLLLLICYQCFYCFCWCFYLFCCFYLFFKCFYCICFLNGFIVFFNVIVFVYLFYCIFKCFRKGKELKGTGTWAHAGGLAYLPPPPASHTAFPFLSFFLFIYNNYTAQGRGQVEERERKGGVGRSLPPPLFLLVFIIFYQFFVCYYQFLFLYYCFYCFFSFISFYCFYY